MGGGRYGDGDGGGQEGTDKGGLGREDFPFVFVQDEFRTGSTG